MNNIKLKIAIGFIFGIYSCSYNTPFYEEDLFYKSINLPNEVYLTFLNDSVAALNPGKLQECQWQFKTMRKTEDKLYTTNELKLDSMIIRKSGKHIHYSIPGDTMIFQKEDLASFNKDSLRNNLITLYRLYSNGISYDCKFSIDDVKFFYDRGKSKVIESIKNPGSANFQTVSIDPYFVMSNSREIFQSTTTFVTIEMEAKNSFGNYIEGTVYVFFIPMAENPNSYEVVFSKSSVLDSEFRNKMVPEYDEKGNLIKLR